MAHGEEVFAKSTHRQKSSHRLGLGLVRNMQYGAPKKTLVSEKPLARKPKPPNCVSLHTRAMLRDVMLAANFQQPSLSLVSSGARAGKRRTALVEGKRCGAHRPDRAEADRASEPGTALCRNAGSAIHASKEPECARLRGIGARTGQGAARAWRCNPMMLLEAYLAT